MIDEYFKSGGLIKKSVKPKLTIVKKKNISEDLLRRYGGNMFFTGGTMEPMQPISTNNLMNTQVDTKTLATSNLNADPNKQSTTDVGDSMGGMGGWGAAISAVSGLGDDIGQTIGGDAGDFVSGMFKPEKALDMYSQKGVTNTQKVLGTIVPGLGNVYAKNAAENEAMNAKDRTDIAFKNKMLGSNKMANGGMLTEFNNGGTHEQSPINGIPQGIAPNGQVNKVEEGETKWQDYIFSDRLMVDDNTATNYNLPKSMANKTFAEASKRANKLLKERPNDPISKSTTEAYMSTLMKANNDAKAIEEAKLQFANGGRILMASGASPNMVLEYARGGNLYPEGGDMVNGWNDYYKKPQYSVNDYIGGLPNVAERSLERPMEVLPEVGSNKLVNDYLGGFTNYYQRAADDGAIGSSTAPKVKKDLQLGSALTTPNWSKDYGYNPPLSPAELSRMGQKDNAVAKNVDVNKAVSKTNSKLKSIYNKSNDTLLNNPTELMFRTNNNSLTNRKEYADWTGSNMGSFFDNKGLDLKPTGKQNLEIDKLKSIVDSKSNSIKDLNSGLDEESRFGADSLRYAPIAFNALAGVLGKTPKTEEYTPTVIQQPGRLKAQQIDTEQARRGVDQSYQTAINSLAGMSGGSGAAMRSGLVGLGAGYSQGLGQAYLSSQERNAQNQHGVDQFNLQNQQQIAANNVQSMNQAKMYNNQMLNQRNYQDYDNRMSYLGKSAEGLGDIGYEERNKETLSNIFGYDDLGKYITEYNKSKSKKTKNSKKTKKD